MRLRPGNAQHPGARDAQQDSFGFSDLADQPFTAHAGLLGAVADGMGGLEQGGAASARAIRTLLASYAAKAPHEPIDAALRRALDDANRAVLDVAAATPGARAPGTTLAVAVVHYGGLHWLSVGDSRIYVAREGTLAQVTVDHTYATELDAKVLAGTLGLDAALADPDRDALTSHLGMPHLPLVDGSAQPLPLQARDRVLVCSDGLYRALTEAEMCADLFDNPQRACEALVARALGKALPHQDNVTALVIGLDADDVSSHLVSPRASR